MISIKTDSCNDNNNNKKYNCNDNNNDNNALVYVCHSLLFILTVNSFYTSMNRLQVVSITCTKRIEGPIHIENN